MTNEELVMQYQSSHDQEEKKEILSVLYQQNSGLLAIISRKYEAFCELDDLMQEAFIGLNDAVEHYDSSKGVKFVSFAYMRISQAIFRYTQENRTTVRIPEYQRSMIMKYESFVSEYYEETSKQPSERLLMLHLGISLEQLKQLRKDADIVKMKSLDSPIDELEQIALVDTIADERNQYEEIEADVMNLQLSDVLWEMVDSELDSTQATIIHDKYQHNTSAMEISKKLGISKSRVYTNEYKALDVLRKRKNRKKLEPFFSESRIFSISIECSGYGYYKNSGCSAPEKVILMAEEQAARH